MSLSKRTRCCVWIVLKYSFETVDYSEKKLYAFGLWCCRTLLKISWTDFISNVTVMSRLRKQRKITVERWYKVPKMKYLAHKIWENGVFTLAAEGRIQGKLIKGRRRLEWVTTNSPCKKRSDMPGIKKSIRYMLSAVTQECYLTTTS